jgi:glycosyltransferase involved in cell wall biosynthesis
MTAVPDPGGYRVALVLGASGGGMRAHVRMLATGLADRGAQVTVLGPQPLAGGGAMARETRPSFRRIEIGDRPRLQDVAALVRLRGILLAGGEPGVRAGGGRPGGPGAGSRGPDVVHAHGLRAGALSALALWPLALRAGRSRAGPTRRPALVVTVHNGPPLARGGSALAYRALEVIVARGADVVLCVSGDLEARMRAAGARRVGHAVVPAPRAPQASDQQGASAPVPGWAPGERPVVLAVGRLAPQKGFGVLLEAAASWRDMRPVPLVVIAGEGPLAAGLRERAAAIGVDALFLGRRDDVPGLLAAADVIAIPSLWEGQPLIVQEALRAGVPIVATRVGGIPRLTGVPPVPGAGGDRQGDTGAAVLVRPDDWRDLAAAIRAVLTDQALAARLRAAARRQAAALPSEADAVTAALAAYADALASAQ